MRPSEDGKEQNSLKTSREVSHEQTNYHQSQPNCHVINLFETSFYCLNSSFNLIFFEKRDTACARWTDLLPKFSVPGKPKAMDEQTPDFFPKFCKNNSTSFPMGNHNRAQVRQNTELFFCRKHSVKTTTAAASKKCIIISYQKFVQRGNPRRKDMM